MNIAIIEDDQCYLELLRDWITKEQTDWNVDFFADPTEFGQVPLTKYNVIIADYDLPGTNGLNLLKSIAKKTKASLALMSGLPEVLSKEEVVSVVPQTLSKEKPKRIIEWFHYIEAKLRIKNMMAKEEQGLNTMILATSGHTVEIKDKVALFGIAKQVNSKDKEKLFDLFKQVYFKIVAYFYNGTITSTQLSILVHTYKMAQENGGELVLWSKGNKVVVEIIHACTLNKILDIFEDLEEAIKYLSK